MAGSTREYELLFLMKAQMDASIGQFSLVGGQVQALEEKIQQYNNTLKNMEGYRQQTAALDELEGKMRALEAGTEGVNQKFDACTAKVKEAQNAVTQHQAAIDALNVALKTKAGNTEENRVKLAQETIALRESKKALQEAKQAENEARKEKDAHQKSIDATRVSLENQRKALQQVIEKLKEAGVDTGNLEAAEKRLRQELEETANIQEKWATFGNRVKEINAQFMVMRQVANATMGPVKAILDFYKESLGAAAELEYGMSAVEAISGATAMETARMKAVVKEMGATTIFTATEAAGAMEKMALAGWETEQMIAGLPAVVKLAAAAGEGLSEMTSIVSDGMNAFHLTGEQAAVKFADVLAKAATSSNTNVGLLGQSLSYVETTAGNLGYTIEDVALALAAMANNALKGGVSGSALNTMLTRMSGANETAAKQMDAMGLSMYYSNGQAKDLLTFLGELRQGFKNFEGDAQAAQIAAYKLAGQRGMRGLLAIVGQTDEQWEKLTADVYNYAGAADQISNTRMDNYTGQVQLLHDAWNALQTSVGEVFLPTATDVVKVLRDMTNGANEFVQENEGLVVGAGASAATLLGLGSALTIAAGGVQLFSFAMNTLSLTKLLSLGHLALIFGGIVIAAGAAAAAIYNYNKNLSDAAQLSKTVKEQAKDFEEVNQKSREAIEVYQDQREEARRLIDELEELGKSYDGSEKSAEAMEYRVDRLNAMFPELGLTFDKAGGSISKTAEELRDFNLAMSEAERTEREGNLANLTGQLLEMESQLEQAREGHAKAIAEMEENEKRYLEMVNQYAMGDSYGAGAQINDPYLVAAGDAAKYRQVITQLEGSIEEAEAAIKAEKAALEAKSRAEMDALGIMELSVGQYDQLTGSVEALAAAYMEAYEESYELYNGIFSAYEKVGEIGKTTTAEMIQNIQGQNDYFSKYGENLEKIRSYAEGNGIDLSKIWNTFSDGSSDAMMYTNAIVGNLEDLPALIAELEKNEALKSSLAEYQAGINEQVLDGIEQLEKDIEAAVAETGAADEAKLAMEATIQGYLDELEGSGNGTGRVTAAINRAAEKWKTAIAASFSDVGAVSSPSGFGPINPNWTGAGVSGASTQGTLPKLTDILSGRFADGTNNALRGWSLVGEEGPELMWTNGGERILPAEKTRTILESPGRAGETVELNMNYTLKGNVMPETARELRKHSKEMEAIVRKVLREKRIDEARRGYD